MAQRNNSNHNSLLGEWLLPLIFLFCLPPVGVLLIVFKLFDTRPRHRTTPHSSAAAGPAAAPGSRTTMSAAATAQAARQAAQLSQPAAMAALARKGRRLTALGVGMTILFGLCFVSDLTDSLWILPDLPWFLEEILPSLCLTAGGLGLWIAGGQQKKKLRRFRQYLATIGRNKTVSISALSSATGRSAHTVREDLQEMLDEGCFPTGFLDYGGDKLVLSTGGIQETPKSAPAPKADTSAENAVLAEIRAVNDAIEHAGLSAQIDRIGVITAKIFDYQKSHPAAAPQLHSFLSYYLPTTLKILRAYAQLEDQGIEGENITAAKQRIEGMMDKVVEGFEKQLDQLFQGDALDITTDVMVLEQMLSKDGLSSDGQITLST